MSALAFGSGPGGEYIPALTATGVTLLLVPGPPGVKFLPTPAVAAALAAGRGDFGGGVLATEASCMGRVCVCVYVSRCVHACARAYVRVCACVHACVRVYVCTCVRACVCAGTGDFDFG